VSGVVAKADEEGIPTVEAVDDVDNTRCHLAGEIGKVGGESIDDQETEEGLGDGLTQSPEFGRQAAYSGALLDDRFVGEHVRLKEANKDGYQASTRSGLVGVHKVLEHGDALVVIGPRSTL
jgi:hypothetical protein